jgi:hypothetical protein
MYVEERKESEEKLSHIIDTIGGTVRIVENFERLHTEV